MTYLGTSISTSASTGRYQNSRAVRRGPCLVPNTNTDALGRCARQTSIVLYSLGGRPTYVTVLVMR